jgi:hypothetical protein
MHTSTHGSHSRTGGPKTLAGKLASAKNAVKHGLHSAQPVIFDFETPEAWEAFQSAFVQSLQPANAAERCLAEEIALTMWRLRRIPLYEARLLNMRLQAAASTWEQFAHHRTNPTEAELQRSLQTQLTEAHLRSPETDQLIRYEAHLDRKLVRLFREFHHLQKLRNELPAANSAQRQGAPHSPLENPNSSITPSPGLPPLPGRDRGGALDPVISESCATNPTRPVPQRPLSRSVGECGWVGEGASSHLESETRTSLGWWLPTPLCHSVGTRRSITTPPSNLQSMPAGIAGPHSLRVHLRLFAPNRSPVQA